MEQGTQQVAAVTQFVQNFVPKLVGAVIVLAVGLWLANLVVGMLQRRMQKTKVDESLQPFLSSLVNVLLKIMVVFSAAGIVGIQTTSFVAMLGAAGLAVGLALQGSLSNFASGVLILLFRPYKVGDVIAVAGFTGEVKEIQIFTTILATVDNRMIIIPNSAITSGPIENTSAYASRVLEVKVPVHPDESLALVRDTLEGAIQEIAGRKAEKGFTAPILELHKDYTLLGARIWVDPALYIPAEAQMKEAIKQALAQVGIRGEAEPSMEIKLQQA